MVATLILAAGQGTRMVSDLPKILHPVGGKPMIHYVIDAALGIEAANSTPQTVVVISPTLDAKAVVGGRAALTAVQPKPIGSGDAVKRGLEAFSQTPKTVLILCGDTPLLEADTLSAVVAQHEARPSPCITVVGMRPENTGAYGRLVVDESGKLDRIVEYRDTSELERAIPLCNSGVMVVEGALLKRLVANLTPQNAAGEYYLTDIVAHARQENILSWVVEVPYEFLRGINTRIDLAAAEAAFQARLRRQFMENGVTLTDPASVFFSHDTIIGRDVTISPNVTFGEGVVVGDRVRILPGCHIEKATLGQGVTVGPFAHLREGTILGDGVTIGNFVEIKSTTMGARTKAKHLSYLGNATIGENVNIGAGTITCNHNGFVKSPTTIGDDAYIGSDSCLVAPLTVGAGAIVAAGSVVSEDVPDNAMAIARQRQENKLTWATQFRKRYQ
ncbi:MAG: bifunctional UDP-N-acetylglucosamine diphosphorylase/glucosamine-1-phosphate N-acetyltransferase GlmU [Alphaproteobacteria bacterium]|jgi:bifunctional UDP-N-acetylglucosamine pyrophosphorylase/glucosamine-1-phosphate N-acetyltransferase|nr:bifunctional UDP-N-acetylglucosamine diphosphorylase/glucosamine-1-phosphate N-acetyltransferase GlmU [Alphaproteobacteria bacterium]